MANVFVEPSKSGEYQIEFADATPARGGPGLLVCSVIESPYLLTR